VSLSEQHAVGGLTFMRKHGASLSSRAPCSAKCLMVTFQPSLPWLWHFCLLPHCLAYLLSHRPFLNWVGLSSVRHVHSDNRVTSNHGKSTH